MDKKIKYLLVDVDTFSSNDFIDVTGSENEVVEDSIRRGLLGKNLNEIIEVLKNMGWVFVMMRDRGVEGTMFFIKEEEVKPSNKWKYIFVQFDANYICSGYGGSGKNDVSNDILDENMTMVLDKLGDSGWEMSGVTQKGEVIIFFFKKPKYED
jgi:hypothetical protein